MWRLFICCDRAEHPLASSIRDWLVSEQRWDAEEICVLEHDDAGEAEAARATDAALAVLFLASEAALAQESLCGQMLARARGPVIAVTVDGLDPGDSRLRLATAPGAIARIIAGGEFGDGLAAGGAGPVHSALEIIGQSLRELGVAPGSFLWTPSGDGPYPGLRGFSTDEAAVFCGREREIRDALLTLAMMRERVSERALVIRGAPGVGASSLLRAGLTPRLRGHMGFAPMGVVCAAGGAVNHPVNGLVRALSDRTGDYLDLPRERIAERMDSDPYALLSEIASVVRPSFERRQTLLIGIDQADEIGGLEGAEADEIAHLVWLAVNAPDDIDLRLAFAVSDDGVEGLLKWLANLGLAPEQTREFRLRSMSTAQLERIALDPATAARKAGYPIDIGAALSRQLAEAAAARARASSQAPALLGLTLRRLVATRRAPDGRIELAGKTAEALVEEATSDAVSEALATAGGDLDELRALTMSRLITIERRGRDFEPRRLGVWETAEIENAPPPREELVEALLEQGVLRRRASGEGFELSHDLLLFEEPFAGIVTGAVERFRRAAALVLETHEWIAAGRSVERLARVGERLREARDLLSDGSLSVAFEGVRDDVSAYIDAGAMKAHLAGARVEAKKRRETLARKEQVVDDQRRRTEMVGEVEAQKTRAKRSGLATAAALLVAVLAGGFGLYSHLRLTQAPAAQIVDASAAADQAEADAREIKQALSASKAELERSNQAAHEAEQQAVRAMAAYERALAEAERAKVAAQEAEETAALLSQRAEKFCLLLARYMSSLAREQVRFWRQYYTIDPILSQISDVGDEEAAFYEEMQSAYGAQKSYYESLADAYLLKYVDAMHAMREQGENCLGDGFEQLQSGLASDGATPEVDASSFGPLEDVAASVASRHARESFDEGVAVKRWREDFRREGERLAITLPQPED